MTFCRKCNVEVGGIDVGCDSCDKERDWHPPMSYRGSLPLNVQLQRRQRKTRSIWWFTLLALTIIMLGDRLWS